MLDVFTQKWMRCVNEMIWLERLQGCSMCLYSLQPCTKPGKSTTHCWTLDALYSKKKKEIHTEGLLRFLGRESSSKFYNANSTSIAHELPLILLAGDVEFRMTAGVILVDVNRLRFKTDSWRMMIVLKTLRLRMREIMEWNLKKPGRPLSPRLEKWMEIVHRVFERKDLTSA